MYDNYKIKSYERSDVGIDVSIVFWIVMSIPRWVRFVTSAPIHSSHVLMLQAYVPTRLQTLSIRMHTSAIGYERDIITPSIDVIIKIADALNVSIDFLVGKTSLELDTQTLGRMEEIAKLPNDKKDYVLGLIDMALRDFKTQTAYA